MEESSTDCMKSAVRARRVQADYEAWRRACPENCTNYPFAALRFFMLLLMRSGSDKFLSLNMMKNTNIANDDVAPRSTSNSSWWWTSPGLCCTPLRGVFIICAAISPGSDPLRTGGGSLCLFEAYSSVCSCSCNLLILFHLQARVTWLNEGPPWMPQHAAGLVCCLVGT